LLNFEGKTEIFHAFQPDNIKKKIVSGEIPYHKARALLPLVVISDDDVSIETSSSRSNRYFFELQRFKVEIETKGNGFLRLSQTL